MILWTPRLLCIGIAASALAYGQEVLRISLPDALSRAKTYGVQMQSATLTLRQATEDRKQAKAATLPQVNGFNQFVYTEGNGTPSGVYVGADGVHVYNEQLQAHEELLALLRRGELRRTLAAEATARARIDVAARGLNGTVIQNFYAIVVAQRRVANGRASLQEALRFLDISEKLERGGEVAHSDVIKAQLQARQREREVQEAQLNVLKARIALAVLIFPEIREDFEVVDDAANDESALPPIAPLAEANALARSSSPDLRVAASSLQEARYGVSVARYAYLPSFGLDVFYGISANQFAAVSGPTQATGRITQPNFEVDTRHNLGYQATATLNIPLWNWGAIRSKVKQASYREQQARLDLTLSERTLRANVATAHSEAEVAQSQVGSLKTSENLAAESLRLTLLRYQAGEATALEVVDAQSTVAQARNAFDDGAVRYRIAVALLGTLTGTL